jgi:hypothetical protein
MMDDNLVADDRVSKRGTLDVTGTSRVEGILLRTRRRLSVAGMDERVER